MGGDGRRQWAQRAAAAAARARCSLKAAFNCAAIVPSKSEQAGPQAKSMR